MQIRKFRYLISIVVIVVILIASIVFVTINNNTNFTKNEKQADNDHSKPVANFSYFGNAVNDFSFKIFKQLYDENEGNIFISPYSIFTALAMTYEGARGDTANEMASVLSIQQDNISFHNYMKSLNDQLNDKIFCNVSTANALWLNKDLRFLENYLDIIKNYYDGNSTNIDFSNPEIAADIINRWVENKTNGLITDLLTKDNIDPFLTAMILTNAIYFKGNWAIQFDPSNTTNRGFTLPTGNSIDVPTMSMVETYDYFNYTETDDLQILELPYSGNEYSMIIVLPKENDLSSVINSIDNNDLSDWVGSFEEKKVDIYFPKFELESKYSLKDALIKLGMAKSFTGSADFSGITTEYGLWIDDVIHKAYVKVNEEGTEAAASTASVIVFTGIEPKLVFNVDHPFIFMIQHKDTGTILFMGSVGNPLE